MRKAQKTLDAVESQKIIRRVMWPELTVRTRMGCLLTRRAGWKQPLPGASLEGPIRIGGNTQGLAAQPLRRLERLAQRRCPEDVVVGPELARTMTELANDVQRQVGALDRPAGLHPPCAHGDARTVYLPDLSDYRKGRDRLCGLRLVHTHLKGEPLSDDDLTDLALLRLDVVAAIEVLADGLPRTRRTRRICCL